MDTLTPQSPWWVLPGLAVGLIGLFTLALVMAFLGEDKTLLNVMCTAAVNLTTLGVGYFFGSSAGSAKKDAAAEADSQRKTEALAQSAPTTTTITAPSTSSAEAATTTTTTQP